MTTLTEIDKAIEAEFKREKRKPFSEQLSESLGFAGKITKFLKEKSHQNSMEERKLKEKELLKILDIDKEKFKHLKKEILNQVKQSSKF